MDRRLASFCYVTDQLEGQLRFIARDGFYGEVIDIDNPIELSVVDLAHLIKELPVRVQYSGIFLFHRTIPHRRCPIITKAQ
jgi:UDP-glucuronate decarboxylase